MKKVVLYSAVSIDGYIATRDGAVDWLDPFSTVEGPDYGYAAFYDSIDAVLLGRKTYQQILGFGSGYPYGEKMSYVFSRERIAEGRNLRWGGADAAAFVGRLKEDSGSDIWLVGGAALNGTLLGAGLIDRMIITTIPVVLGSGVPLFLGAAAIGRWGLDSTKPFSNGVVQNTYSV